MANQFLTPHEPSVMRILVVAERAKTAARQNAFRNVEVRLGDEVDQVAGMQKEIAMPLRVRNHTVINDWSVVNLRERSGWKAAMLKSPPMTTHGSSAKSAMSVRNSLSRAADAVTTKRASLRPEAADEQAVVAQEKRVVCRIGL